MFPPVVTPNDETRRDSSQIPLQTTDSRKADSNQLLVELPRCTGVEVGESRLAWLDLILAPLPGGCSDMIFQGDRRSRILPGVQILCYSSLRVCFRQAILSATHAAPGTPGPTAFQSEFMVIVAV